MLIDPRELHPDRTAAARFFEWLWPELKALRKPRVWDDTPRRYVRQLVLGERIVSTTLDESFEALARANIHHREGISLRVDATTEKLLVAEFDGLPTNRLRGSTEAALPLPPSITTHVHRGAAPNYLGFHQMIWLYDGKLTGEQHRLLAERLARFNAVSVTTKGLVDLRLPGFFDWSDPERPHGVTSSPALDCGTRAPRYPIDDIDAQLCAPLRQAFVTDPYAA